MANHKASDEWLAQRVTAIIIGFTAIVCISLFLISCIKQTGLISQLVDNIMALIKGETNLHNGLVKMFSSVFAAAVGIIVSWAILYHGAIGMKIVYEDYVRTIAIRKLITAITFFIAYFTIMVCSITILTAHVLSYLPKSIY